MAFECLKLSLGVWNAVREFANKSAASAASPDYVKFQAVIKSAASAASPKAKSREGSSRGAPGRRGSVGRGRTTDRIRTTERGSGDGSGAPLDLGSLDLGGCASSRLDHGLKFYVIRGGCASSRLVHGFPRPDDGAAGSARKRHKP